MSSPEGGGFFSTIGSTIKNITKDTLNSVDRSREYDNEELKQGTNRLRANQTIGQDNKIEALSDDFKDNPSHVLAKISSLFGLQNAPLLKHALGILAVLALGWLLMGCIMASSSSNPTYLLYMKQCLMIWMYILVIIIFVNSIAILFRNNSSSKKV
jgi:hypothetical protein